MSDQQRMMAGAIVGALVGGLAAFFVLTPGGRRLMGRVNPALDDVSAALQEFRVAVRKADQVAQDTKGAVDDVRTVLAGDRLEGAP